ncbi:ankyrin [Tuber magnatum]|uniref:Ankyrin n=1 Tax=Tuber magnatum TaxID=42249 RepID=A0A317SN92_9PEZI|nr:ankyrin [Tuber magnatum]
MYGRRALYSAAQREDVITVGSLLVRGILTFICDQPGKEVHFLHTAVKTESRNTIRTLLTCGLPSFVRAKYGKTPLATAAEAGNVGAVEALIGSAQVDVNAKDVWDRTPLWLAAWNGYAGVVGFLLGRTDVEANSQQSNTDFNGHETPLAIACRCGHASVVQELLADERVDVNSRDDAGFTPIHLSITNSRSDILRLLLSHSFVDPLVPHVSGRTPLHTAAELGNLDAFRQLLGHPNITDPNIPAADNWTPLGLAAWNGREGIVRALVNDGRVNVNGIAGASQTAVFLAAKRMWLRVVKELLEVKGVDVYKRGEEGGVSFAEFVEAGNDSRMKELLAMKLESEGY